jgi:hypothetical protein
MRNIFDQYEQAENRLTHALAATLDADRSLLRPFLKWSGAGPLPAVSNLDVTEQQVPGEYSSGEERTDSGLPDACIFSDTDEWAFIVESKIQSPINEDQLRRHRKTAIRYGFEKVFIFLIAIDSPTLSQARECDSHATWREIYSWFKHRSKAGSDWPTRLTNYMEVLETSLVASDALDRGTLTMFDGIHFEKQNRYNYREARRLIRLLGDELQCRPELHAIGIDPKGKRRTAITGSDSDSVWDILPLKAARNVTDFRHYPHFDIGIDAKSVSAHITFPNGISGMKARLNSFEIAGIEHLFMKIEKSIRPTLKACPGAKPYFYLHQRHFKSQRSKGITDGRMDVDLRTLLPGGSGGAKQQPGWIDAFFSLLTNKRSNIQFGVYVSLPHECSEVRSPRSVKHISNALIAISPLLELFDH